MSFVHAAPETLCSGPAHTCVPRGLSELLKLIEADATDALAQSLWSLRVRSERLRDSAQAQGVSEILEPESVVELAQSAYHDVRDLLAGLKTVIVHVESLERAHRAPD